MGRRLGRPFLKTWSMIDATVCRANPVNASGSVNNVFNKSQWHEKKKFLTFFFFYSMWTSLSFYVIWASLAFIYLFFFIWAFLAVWWHLGLPGTSVSESPHHTTCVTPISTHLRPTLTVLSKYPSPRPSYQTLNSPNSPWNWLIVLVLAWAFCFLLLSERRL